jgi:methylmalonyl-CoA/ethylmalonyl-CoA epimerase
MEDSMEHTMTAVTEGFGLSQIGQITVVVHDVPRAVAFYRDVLGLRFLFEAPPGLAFFDCGGIRLMLSRPEGEVDYRAATIYYTVPDIQQAAAVLGSRGVVFDQPPHVVARLPHADLWMAFFHDVDRNLLAIMSEVPRV